MGNKNELLKEWESPKCTRVVNRGGKEERVLAMCKTGGLPGQPEDVLDDCISLMCTACEAYGPS